MVPPITNFTQIGWKMHEFKYQNFCPISRYNRRTDWQTFAILVGNEVASSILEMIMNGTPGSSQDYSTYWGKEDAYNKSSEYWCGKSQTFPATVWMQFPKPHRLAEISFKTYYAGTIYFEVVGSQDCADWTTLLNTNSIFIAKETKKFPLPLTAASFERFSCIGLRFSKKPENAKKEYACVGSVRMWE